MSSFELFAWSWLIVGFLSGIIDFVYTWYAGDGEEGDQKFFELILCGIVATLMGYYTVWVIRKAIFEILKPINFTINGRKRKVRK